MSTSRNIPNAEKIEAVNDATSAALERREFLTGAVVTGTALAASVAGESVCAADGLRASGRARPTALSGFACDDFQAVVGEEFMVTGQAGSPLEPVTLVVRDVVSIRHPSDANRPGGVRPSGYIVHFAARSGRLGGEGIYRLHHHGLEASPVFLQPSHQSTGIGETLYEAIFN